MINFLPLASVQVQAYFITLLIITSLLSSCLPSSSNDPIKKTKTVAPIVNTKIVPTLLTNPPAASSIKNFNNKDELLALSNIENQIRNISYLIKDAKALQNENARYKFAYQNLRLDLSEISNSINRFIRQDKTSQLPRIITPLNKRY